MNLNKLKITKVLDEEAGCALAALDNGMYAVGRQIQECTGVAQTSVVVGAFEVALVLWAGLLKDAFQSHDPFILSMQNAGALARYRTSQIKRVYIYTLLESQCNKGGRKND